MPVAGPFSQVTSARHWKGRLCDLEAVVGASVAERYEASRRSFSSLRTYAATCTVCSWRSSSRAGGLGPSPHPSGTLSTR